MQDLSPEAIDHAEIMRLIRDGAAFRAVPSLPLPDPDFTPLNPVAEDHPHPGPLEIGPSEPPSRAASPAKPGASAASVTGSPETEIFQPAPPPPEIDLALIRAEAHAAGRAEAEAGLSAARAAAHAEGFAQGRAEAMAEIGAEGNAARDSFLAATAALTAASDAATATVFAAVEAAILRLASDRAGLAIDDNPAPFRARIETLAARIAGAGATAEIRLNPEDLAALAGTGSADRFTADATLARGDVVVRAGDVVIEDILAGSRP